VKEVSLKINITLEIDQEIEGVLSHDGKEWCFSATAMEVEKGDNCLTFTGEAYVSINCNCKMNGHVFTGEVVNLCEEGIRILGGKMDSFSKTFQKMVYPPGVLLH
jgi:hypothetical protein